MKLDHCRSLGSLIDSQRQHQLKHGTGFSQLKPTQLDEIKNLHPEIRSVPLPLTAYTHSGHYAGPIIGQSRAKEARVGLSQSHFR